MTQQVERIKKDEARKVSDEDPFGPEKNPKDPPKTGEKPDRQDTPQPKHDRER